MRELVLVLAIFGGVGTATWLLYRLRKWSDRRLQMAQLDEITEIINDPDFEFRFKEEVDLYMELIEREDYGGVLRLLHVIQGLPNVHDHG